MFEQTNIKIIICTVCIFIMTSCATLSCINKDNFRRTTFEYSLRESIALNHDTISNNCISQIVKFREGLYYSEKMYKHRNNFETAWEQILPCMKELHLASWYVVFSDLMYQPPTSPVLEPIYYILIKSDLNPEVLGYSFVFEDSLFRQGETIIHIKRINPESY